MTTYREFQAELERLHQQAQSARRQEKAAALERIRALIIEYQIFPHELGFGKPPRTSAEGTPVRYRDPVSGATWSGRGRAPKWIQDQDRSRFAV